MCFCGVLSQSHILTFVCLNWVRVGVFVHTPCWCLCVWFRLDCRYTSKNRRAEDGDTCHHVKTLSRIRTIFKNLTKLNPRSSARVIGACYSTPPRAGLDSHHPVFSAAILEHDGPAIRHVRNEISTWLLHITRAPRKDSRKRPSDHLPRPHRYPFRLQHVEGADGHRANLRAVRVAAHHFAATHQIHMLALMVARQAGAGETAHDICVSENRPSMGVILKNRGMGDIKQQPRSKRSSIDQQGGKKKRTPTHVKKSHAGQRARWSNGRELPRRPTNQTTKPRQCKKCSRYDVRHQQKQLNSYSDPAD